MSRVIVIGAGVMGLAAAYHAAKAGHDIVVLEAAPEPGGMAAHFDFGGLSLERFYHFICKADTPTFELLKELGLESRLQWRATSMGYYIDGELYEWGNPLALLRFPHLSLLGRLRYGLLAFMSVRREHWDALEHQTAREWVVRWAGEEVWSRLWLRLLKLKFHDYADNISAAWIWTRVKRIGRSRRSIWEEELGYLEGGSQTLVDALCAGIQAHGGQIRLCTPALEVLAKAGRVTGVRIPSGIVAADAVISTMPVPLVSALIPALSAEWKAKYDAIENIGVCCLVFKLRQKITPHFWVNIVDSDIEIPGIIEYSNLRPLDSSIVFVPYYMPAKHPKFQWTDEALLDEAFGYLRRLNENVTEEDLIDRHCARLRYAQPVCAPGFAAKIPPVQTSIAGLQVADTCFYYPEDRGIAESVRLGQKMAAGVVSR